MSDKDRDSVGPVSRTSRFFKLAGMTASVASNYAASKLKTALGGDDENSALHKLNGERIAKTLGELKGAAMKIGQMASIGSELLPKELADAMTKLQKDAPPMPFEAIRKQIVSEFGMEPERLFDRFDETPFASASIGQVHRARTDDGRDVVVKVQYPGVDTSVDSDLSHLKLALKASGLINKAHRSGLDRVFAEVRARLHEELDYCNEADNVRLFRQYFANDPKVVIPDVVGERSSKRILTLTFEPSDSIEKLEELGYDLALRSELATRLFDAMAAQIFDLKAVHADPNPANFGFRRDGSIVLYDFGCVKRLGDNVLVPYRAAIEAGIDERWDDLDRAMFALGARNPDGPPVEPAYYKQWRDLFLEPIRTPEPYDYGSAALHERGLKMVMVPDFLKRMQSFLPPSELVFVDRAVVGNFGHMRKLGAKTNVRASIDRYTGLNLAERGTL